MLLISSARLKQHAADLMNAKFGYIMDGEMALIYVCKINS